MPPEDGPEASDEPERRPPPPDHDERQYFYLPGRYDPASVPDTTVELPPVPGPGDKREAERQHNRYLDEQRFAHQLDSYDLPANYDLPAGDGLPAGYDPALSLEATAEAAAGPADGPDPDRQDGQYLDALALYDRDEAHAEWEGRLAQKEYLDEIQTPLHDPTKDLEWDEKNWSRSEYHRWNAMAAGDQQQVAAAAHLTSVRSVGAGISQAPPDLAPHSAAHRATLTR